MVSDNKLLVPVAAICAAFVLSGCDAGSLFSSTEFMPHGYCLSWDPALLSLFVIGNVLIAIAYYSIPAALWVFISKRKDLVFDWMFRLFAAFISFCGTTHVLKLWTIWHATYWLEALMDLATGLLSVVTAVLLWRLIPRALMIRSPKEWEKANAELSASLENLKNAQTALRENEEFTRQIIEEANDAFVAIDRQGCIIEWNARAEKLFRRPKAEVVGTRLDEMVVPNGDADILQKDGLQRLITTGAEDILNERVEMLARDKDGKDCPVELSVFSVPTAGKPVYCAFINDITERKSAEEAIKYARDQALASSKFKSEFLANMSHEIRTPMNGILGMAEILSRSQLPDKERTYAATLHEAAESLLSVLNDILDFSKIEAGKLVLTDSEFDPIKLVESVADLLTPQAREKGLTVLTFIDSQVPESLVGDAGRLRQVLVNLVSNAVKFSEKGAILIRAAVETLEGGVATVRFSVADKGIGMSEEEIARLFEPFVQLDGSSTRQRGGTGLGLSISKRLIEMMHGEIGVHSVAGHGSKFWFSVPLRVGSGQDNRIDLKSELAGTNILVVDDEEVARDILREYVTSWGMKCTMANSAESAISLLRESAEKTPFDIVVIDLLMPGTDGLGLGKMIKEEKSCEPKLILVTGFDKPGIGEEAVLLGFDAYLTKPVKQSLLLDCIATVVREGRSGFKRLAAASQVKGEGSMQQGTREELILIVEDHRINQEVAFLQLRQLGFEAHVASNGMEALELVQKIDYDLVFMDCQMPVVDGFEATRAIRKMETRTGKHLPIIAMTAHALEGSREECLSAGMDDYVSKPIGATRLAIVLDKWLPVRGDAEESGSGTVGTAADIAAEAIEPSLPVVDLAALREVLGTNPLKPLLRDFITEAGIEIGKLKEAARAKNLSDFYFVAHSLKGISATVHALHMVHICRSLNVQTLGDNWTGLNASVGKLEEALANVAKTLERDDFV